MFTLALSTLKFRRASFIATFFALFLGAAIVMACGGLMETGLRIAVPAQRLAAAPIVVTGVQTHDDIALTERNQVGASLLDTVRGVPGVGKAVSDVSFPATVLVDGKAVTGETPAYGHNWSASELTPYTLTEGTAPGKDGEVVLDAELAALAGARPGSTVETNVRGVVSQFLVTGVTASKGDSVTQRSMFFSDIQTPRLSAPGGKIDSIGVIPAEGTDAIALAAALETVSAGKATVLTGESRGLAEFPAALGSQRTLTILSAIFGSWALLIAMFGVASMLGLALQQRQREMALLRAIGSTPRQVLLMVLGETAVLSVVATALAVAPGYLLGKLLFGQLRDNGVVSDAMAFHQGPIPTVVGAVTAIVAALGATMVAGRQAAHTKPIAALTESAVQGRWLTKPRLIIALFFLINGVTMSVITVAVMDNGPILASTAGPASVLVGIGLALLAPGITKAMVRVLRRPVHAITGLSGYLAVLNATARSVRMAGAVAPIVLLVGIAAGTLYMQSTENSVKAKVYSENLLADYVLTSPTGFSAGVLTSAAAVPGVAGASELVTSNGFVDGAGGGSDFSFRGVSAGGAERTVAVDTLAGSLSDLRGDTAAISDKQAAEFGVGIGDTLPIHLGDGSAIQPKVVAIHTENTNDESILLPAETLAPHTTVGRPSQILVRATTGTDLTRLRAGLDTLASGTPGTLVEDRAALISKNSRVQQILVSANYTIVAMIVGYAAITVINTLVAATRKRRREFDLQRLTGSTCRQVLGMLSVESGLIAIVAIVLGTIAAASTTVPYALVKSGTVLPSGSIWIYLSIVGAAIVLTFGSVLLPSWRGMRKPPIETMNLPD